MKTTVSLVLSSLLLASPLNAAELGTVTPQQLAEKQQTGQALVIDIRTEKEWQTDGVIANSHKLQSFDKDGNFDRETWLANLEKLKSSPNQPVILVCRSGNRSGKVGEFLSRQQGMNNVYHLSGGLQSWVKSGQPLSPNCQMETCK